MYPITKKLIANLPRIPYRHGRGKPEGIVFHCTASPRRPDSAILEASYESRAWSEAFVHYFVDDKTIVQVADTDYLAWGCGEYGNPRFLQMELCMFDPHDQHPFDQAYSRYLELAARLLLRYRLRPTGGAPYGTLWSHRDVTRYLGGTTHTDPEDYFFSHGINWAMHLSNVRRVFEKLEKRQQYVAKTGWFSTLSEAESAAARVQTETGWHSWAERAVDP